MSDLNFDPKRHDHKVDAAAQQEIDRQLRDTKEKISRAFDQRALSFKSKRKPTVTDVKAFIADIEELVQKHANHPGLADWRSETLRLVREKIELLRITAPGDTLHEHNCFTPFNQQGSSDIASLPSVMQTTVRYSFQTRPEFERVQQIARVMSTGGFGGFLLDSNVLVALYGDGELVRLGMVVNGKGLDHIPSLRQYQAELKRHRKKGKKKK